MSAIISPTCSKIEVPKLSFLRRNLKGCSDKLKQTAYFSVIGSFMEYGVTVWDPYQKYNSDKVEMVQRRAAGFVKSRYSRYSRCVGMDASFSKETGGSTYSVLLNY